MHKTVVLLLVCWLTVQWGVSANTYYVSIAGSDLNPGTQAQPWRTIQKAANTMIAGDSVVVSPGDYAESIVTTADGTSNAPIVFRAAPANDPNNQVIVRQFRISNRYIVIDGFNLTGASDLNNAAIRIEAPSAAMDGSFCVITNNTIRDGVYLISTNASFGSDFVHVTDGSFTAAGFTNGSLVFFGSDSMYTYTNHDTAHTVQSVSPDGKTLFVTDTLASDPGSNYWAAIYAGSGNSAFKGVLFALGATAAHNCLIVGNTFSNLFGPNMWIFGESNSVVGNKFFDMHGWYAMQANGANMIIESNLFLNSPNIIFFTPQDQTSIQHPLGGNYFDYQVNVIDSYADGSTNNLFEHNWLQNCDNQLLMIEQDPNSYGFVIRSNVFVGMQCHGSFSRSDLTFSHNTFYKCSYYLGESQAMGIGGVSGTIQSGLVVTSNAFVDIGSHEQPNSEGYFGLVDSTNYVLGSNFCAGAEVMGWKPVGPNPGGISVNGGDPIFVNAQDPLGPDGLPFTADDGLRPLPNSPLAIYGIGAEPSLRATFPIAHFTVASPTGWFDATGTNYDRAWAALKPHERKSDIRPWTTADALGTVPVWVTFDASQSIDGLDTNDASCRGIRWYAWDFGDGRKDVVYKSPTIKHLFLSNGTFNVTLTITNLEGQSSVYSNSYRVLPMSSSFSNKIWRVSTNGSDSNDGITRPFRTISKAATVVNAGDFVAVSAGDYGENVDLNRNTALPNKPITFYSYGARSGGFNIRYSDYVVDGFDLNGAQVPTYGYLIYVYPNAQRVQILHNDLHGCTNLNGISLTRGSTGLDPSASPGSCTVSYNWLHDMWGSGDTPLQIVAYGQSNVFQGNVFYNSQGQPDCFRVWGLNQTICDNYAFNMAKIVENHVDFYQIFGAYTASSPSDYDLARNIMIERNVIDGGQISIATMQMFTATNMPGNFTNIVFRNNIFKDLPYGLDAACDGVKVYNNLFYQCPVAAAHMIVMGGGTGSAYGTEVYNNIFFMDYTNPLDASAGWYDIHLNGNSALSADYNFVCGANYSPKNAAPPNDFQHWGSNGYEAHGINGGNPLFANALIGDFRLLAGSPLLASGVNLGGRVPDDMDGIARPASGPWTIGPYQSTSLPVVVPKPIAPSALRVLSSR